MVDIQYERFILTNETHSFSNNLSLKPVKMADKTAKTPLTQAIKRVKPTVKQKQE